MPRRKPIHFHGIVTLEINGYHDLFSLWSLSIEKRARLPRWLQDTGYAHIDYPRAMWLDMVTNAEVSERRVKKWWLSGLKKWGIPKEIITITVKSQLPCFEACE